MKQSNSTLWAAFLTLPIGALVQGAAMAQPQKGAAPIVIQEQGSFAVGGSVKTEPGAFDLGKPLNPAGQTYHGDHAYVFYQVPPSARRHPLVMWHGAGQFSKTWETTPDGREGFQNIFLRRGFSTYVIDQPRRGRSGRAMVEAAIKPIADELFWFDQFRIGIWPDYFDGVQFARDPETLNQYFRAMTPNTGPFDINVISDAVSALFSKIGPGILVTHSQSGGPGLAHRDQEPECQSVVAFEPGSNFVFPEGEVPAPIVNAPDTLRGVAIPHVRIQGADRNPDRHLLRRQYPGQPTTMPRAGQLARPAAMARLWAEAVNKHGGDVTVMHLPEIGIRGNTHFLFSDLNNVEIADQVSKFLAAKKLD